MYFLTVKIVVNNYRYHTEILQEEPAREIAVVIMFEGDLGIYAHGATITVVAPYLNWF